MAKKTENEVTYEIVETLATITKNRSGWTKELNLVAWNGAEPKYDIREWSPNHDHLSKGITLTDAEMREIVRAVANRF